MRKVKFMQKVYYYRRVCKIKWLKYNLSKRRSVEIDLDMLGSSKNPLFSGDSFCFGRFEWGDQVGNRVGLWGFLKEVRDYAEKWAFSGTFEGCVMDGDRGGRSVESADKWGNVRDLNKNVKNLPMFGEKINGLIFKENML